MGAPTWPTDADSKDGSSGGRSDEEAERAILRAFLFGDPPRHLGEEEAGTTLHSLQRRLEAWLHMVCEGDFKLAAGTPAGTDGQHLFLPPALPLPIRPDADVALFRVMGFFQRRLVEGGFLEDRALLGEIYRDWSLRSCYHLLVAHWILADGAKRFPGLARDLEVVVAMESAGRLRVNLTEVPREGIPHAFLPLYEGLTICLNWPEAGPQGQVAREAVQALRAAKTDAAARLLANGKSRQLVEHFRSLRLGPPPVPDFLGLIRPEWILGLEARELEANEDWKKGQLPLRRLRQAVKERRASALGSRLRDKLRDKMALPPEGSVSKLPAYGPARDAARAELAEQGQAEWKPGQSVGAITTGAAGEDLLAEGHPHHEWDHERRAYRIHATRVLSPVAQGGPLENYRQITQKHRREIAQIRRRFEALRVEERWIGRQLDGPELDLEAVVRAWSDLAAGHQPQQNIYRRFVRQRRDLCVMTLVDLSGSTKGAVLYEQQRGIVLFAEALQSLALPHAFYGFNGSAPTDCRLYRLKGFEEGYEEDVLRRLGNLRAEGGTRLGAHIREASRLLDQQPQGRRLLLLLSDGRPEARGVYRGVYGEKDSEMAVQEARRMGVQIHCISMDASETAPEYLRAIFGPGHYHLMDRAEALPFRLAEVFRGLVK
jgi:uncharacterized protein YegL